MIYKKIFFCYNNRIVIKDILKSSAIIKESEDKYRKADARFKSIVENVFVGIKLSDANWKIIYRSPSTALSRCWELSFS